MTKQAIEMTQEGVDKLKAELEDLITNRRVDVTEKIKNARSLGDLSENSLYDQARAEQAFVEGRIQEIEVILEQAKIIQSGPADQVSLGSKVVVQIDEDQEEYTIVGEPEADPANAKLSHTSPLGQALLGKKVGEEVKVDAPAGTISYRIQSIA